MISGAYYDGVTSKAVICQMEVNDNNYVYLHDTEFAPCPFDEITISSRVANTSRIISLPGGGRFESQDNDAIDRLLEKHSDRNGLFDPHQWESKFKLVAVLGVLTSILIFGFATIGLPAASNAIAHQLPAYVPVSLAEELVQDLDESYLKKSELDEQKKTHISELFERYIPQDSQFHYRLIFRKGGRFGANAMALPDGTIVITDELVELSSNDQELVAVLLHEIGHIEHRHSLRNLVEAAGLYALYSWVSGDLEVSSVVILTLSGLLLKANYSRDHESEADAYSLENMLSNNINPNYFPSIMQKIEGSHKRRRSKNQDTDKESPADKSEAKEEKAQLGEEVGKTILDYLSTHPTTQERIIKFKETAKSNNYPDL